MPRDEAALGDHPGAAVDPVDRLPAGDHRTARVLEPEAGLDHPRLPPDRARRRIQREHVGVVGGDDDEILPEGDGPGTPTAAGHPVRERPPVLPEERAVRGVERLDRVAPVREEHDAVADERRRLAPRPVLHPPDPGELELVHVTGMDLVERAVSPGLDVAARAQPVGRIRVAELGVRYGREVRDRPVGPRRPRGGLRERADVREGVHPFGGRTRPRLPGRRRDDRARRAHDVSAAEHEGAARCQRERVLAGRHPVLLHEVRRDGGVLGVGERALRAGRHRRAEVTHELDGGLVPPESAEIPPGDLGRLVRALHVLEVADRAGGPVDLGSLGGLRGGVGRLLPRGGPGGSRGQKDAEDDGRERPAGSASRCHRCHRGPPSPVVWPGSGRACRGPRPPERACAATVPPGRRPCRDSGSRAPGGQTPAGARYGWSRWNALRSAPEKGLAPGMSLRAPRSSRKRMK